MADERIVIDYVTRYIQEGHGDSLRDSVAFNKQLKEGAYVTARGAASVEKYRKELEQTNPQIAQTTRELDRLNKIYKRNGELSKEQRAEKTRLLALLKAERTSLREIVAAQKQADDERVKSMNKAAAAQERALLREQRNIDNYIKRLDNLGNSHIKNAKKTEIFQRQVDNLTLRSTRRAISGVHEWVTTLGTIIAPAIPQFLSLLSGAIGTVATAAVGAASSIAKLTPAVGAAGVAILGVVQVTKTWKLAMRDMDKLIESAMFDNIDDFVDKMKDFTPAAQDFAITMRQKVKPALMEWQRVAQGNIFGGINKGMNALLPRRGLVTDIVRQTSSAMGGAIGNFGQELARPEWADAFKELGTNNARWIKELGAAAIPTSRALRDLTLAGQPIIDWAVEGTTKLSKTFETFITGKRATGELAREVQAAKRRMEDFVDIGASAGSSVLSVLKAGQQTGDMLTSGLRDQANAAQEWSRSFEGQRRMSEWFLNMQPAMVESGRLAKDLAGTLARTAEQSSIDILVRQLRVDLLPTLEETMINVNRSMGPLLIETVVNLLQAFTSATSPNGPVTMLVNGVNQLAQAFQKMTEIPVASTLLRWTLGLAALFRVARLAGVLVGGRMIASTLRAGRTRAEMAAERVQLQTNVRDSLIRAHPEAYLAPRDPTTGKVMRDPVTGRFMTKQLDMSRLPPEVQRQVGPVFAGGMEKSWMERLRTGELAKDWRHARESGATRFAAMRGSFAGTGVGRVGIGAGILMGGIATQQAAGAMGASSRAQSIIGMGVSGAATGAMMTAGTGPGMILGAAVGGIVGGLAGFGVSLLGAKKNVDDFASRMFKATSGLAATQQAVASLRRNQGQLRLGVRGAEIELRQAVSARDTLTRGMNDREFEKFSKTDTYRAAQLRIDTARSNLNDLRSALNENTEQLKLANERLKQDAQRPKGAIQLAAGRAGGRLAEINREIENVRNRRDITGAQRRERIGDLRRDRAKVISDFAREMTQASREAAANSQPFFARMFANAAAVAMKDGRIGTNLFNQVQRVTRQGIRISVVGGRTAEPRGRRSPAEFQGNRAGGGRITWGSPSADASPAMLAQGEFVVTGGGEQMLEQMTFPGVLNWLEGAQPPHFLRGGRMRGPGDMEDRRRKPTVGPFFPKFEDDSGFTPYEMLMSMLVPSGSRAGVVKFPRNSPLGKLQASMGYADGGFARRAILAPFRGSFSSGFSAGSSGQIDALAGLYADLVSSGTFDAVPAASESGKGGKGKEKPNLKGASPKVKRLAAWIQGQLGKIPFVPGGGHGATPGPSKPSYSALLASGMSAREARARANEPGAKSGLDHSGFVRYALSRGGFGDPGQHRSMLQEFGKGGPGKWLTVLTKPGPDGKAYLRVGGVEYGYMGRSPKNPVLNSRGRSTMPEYLSRHVGNFRRGGRAGARRFAAGGRVGSGLAIPTVTGAAGPAANKAWATNVMGYLQSLTTASLNSISGAVEGLGNQVVALTQKADTSPAGQQLLARVSALLDAASFAMGERLGAMQKEIEDMGKASALRRTRLERSLVEREINPDSAGGLAQELTQLRREAFGENGLMAQIRKQRALVGQAQGTDEAQQLQDRLDELIGLNADNRTARLVTRRGLHRARDQKGVNQAGFALENAQFGMQRLQLRQQIGGMTEEAGNAQLQRYITKQMLPVLQAREKAAHTAMVRERQRTGRGSEAFRQAQDQWQQAVLDRLGAQAESAEKTADNTDTMARKLSGSLSFDFMGERHTDLIGSGTGI